MGIYNKITYMKQVKTHKEKIIHRIQIIEGHIKAIKSMIDQDAYCVDIVLQSLAVQKALKGLDSLIVTQHLKTCMIDQIKNGKEDQAIKELNEIYKLKD